MRQCRFVIIGVAIVLAILMVNSCRDSIPSGPVAGTSLIVPGVSIDGVALGDYPEVVEQKIGRPQEWGYLAHHFTQGVHKGLWILYLEGYVADSLVWGPANYLWVDTSYEGKTKEGVGIGSTTMSVIAAWGLPGQSDTTRFPRWGYYRYSFKGKTVTMTFEGNRVVRLGMGYFMDPQW